MPGPPSHALRGLAAPIAAALAGTIVFRDALGYYFSQDDFLGLARARGLAPRLEQIWRYLSNQALWDLLRPLGIAEAWPYHALSLVVHAACVILLHGLMARRVAAPAALLGATFFAAHPSLFTGLYWISAIGDPLSLCFALLALHFAQRSDGWRWLSVPLFALGLLAKESIVLLPALMAAHRAWSGPHRGGPGSARSRAVDGTVIALAAVSIAYVAYFVAAAYGTYFVSRTVSAGTVHSPYAVGLGSNLWENLLTYLGWTVVFASPSIHGFNDVIEPGLHPWAAGALALWIAGAAWRPLRERGWLFGGIAWLLLLLPVLPVRNHTYHYYLYAPLAGAAWCVASAADLAFSGRGRWRVPGGEGARSGARTRWLIACAGAAALALNGAMVVRGIETAPFTLPGLRADPIVDRARIARTVRDDLGASPLPPGVTLLFWSPTAASIGPRGEPLGASAPIPTYWERNVNGALLGGLAVRVMFPQVADVRFVREFRPTSPDVWYAAYKPDGSVRVATSAAVDSILRAARR